jgi:chloramphenicol-sensitive protein RarD
VSIQKPATGDGVSAIGVGPSAAASSTPIPDAQATRRAGILSAVGAFVTWGILPLYWAQIARVPALEIIAHRILWGGLFAWAIVAIQRWWWRRSARPVHGQGASDVADLPRVTPTREPLLPRGAVAAWLVLNSALVITNWLVYVWAVTNDRTLDASLGYYINPLVSVLLGMVFLRERLTRLQWAAVASACTGVLFFTIRLGVFPWVSLTLAFSFGTYGLIKKRTRLPAIHSLALELLPFQVVTVVYLVVLGLTGRGNFVVGDPRTAFFLGASGVVTVMPLLLFGMAARRIRLSDVGFLQYIAPTMMFFLAIFVFGDPLEPARLVGFAFVWLGLALYTASNFSGRIRV